MSDLIAALLGALVGGLFTVGTAAWIFRAERSRRTEERREAERRGITMKLVQVASTLRECIVNPSRNADRMASVESEAEAILTLFIAQLKLPEEAPVSEFTTRLLHAVRFASARDSVWADAETLRQQALVPLVGWAIGDTTWPADWFKAHLSSNQSEFSTTKYDLEPANIRRTF